MHLFSIKGTFVFLLGLLLPHSEQFGCQHDREGNLPLDTKCKPAPLDEAVTLIFSVRHHPYIGLWLPMGFHQDLCVWSVPFSSYSKSEFHASQVWVAIIGRGRCVPGIAGAVMLSLGAQTFLVGFGTSQAKVISFFHSSCLKPFLTGAFRVSWRCEWLCVMV